jgi:hypothetical protein
MIWPIRRPCSARTAPTSRIGIAVHQGSVGNGQRPYLTRAETLNLRAETLNLLVGHPVLAAQRLVLETTESDFKAGVQ